MARGPTPPRIIPNFAMTAPATDPATNTPENQEGLAEVALLSGATNSQSSIVAVLATFSGNNIDALQQAVQ
jgi:hypothetical protein